MSAKRYFLIAVASTVAMLADPTYAEGAAAPVEDPPPAKVTCETADWPTTATDAADTVDAPQVLFAYLKLRIACPPKAEDAQARIDGYTRVGVVFLPHTPLEGTRRDYGGARPAIVRLLMGKTISRVLSVKAVVTSRNLEGTVALVSASHASNKSEGETWSTSLVSRQWLTPLFRIDPRTDLALEVNLSASTRFDSSVASDVLGIARRAAGLVAPTAALATTLNEDRFKDASQLLDQSLASLFKQSVSEAVPAQFGPGSMNGNRLIEIESSFPLDVEIGKKSPDKEPVPLGRWVVFTQEPLASVFAAVKMPAAGEGTGASCQGAAKELCDAFKSVTPAAVLGYPAGIDTTIGQVLTNDAVITTARDDFLKNTVGSTVAGNAASLCSLVSKKIYELGFNRLDASVVLWAYGVQFGAGSTTGTAFRNTANCPALSAAFAIGLQDRIY